MKPIALLCLLSLSMGSQLVLDGDVAIEAKARGPAGLVVTAKTDKMSVDDTGDTFTVAIPLSSVTTGIGLRDEHMRKSLESDQFPIVTLTLNDSDLKRPVGDDTVGGTTIGKLTLHGVTKSVTVGYETVGDCEDHVGVKASFGIELHDHGITPPSYLGMKVKDHVQVDARFRLRGTGGLR